MTVVTNFSYMLKHNDSYCEKMSERVNEQINKQMNVWMNERK